MKRLQINNMVCPRCLSSVRSVLNDLGLIYKRVELGKVELAIDLSEDQKTKLSAELEARGFELLNSEDSKIVSAIKSIVIDKVH